MRRAATLILGAFVGMFLLSGLLGCGQQAKSTNEIVIWHWMTDRHEAFEKLALKYEEETGIKVSFELFAPSDAYSQKIIAAAQAKVLPEIYGILDKKSIFASFIHAKHVANLTDAFKENNGEWENAIFPRALASNVFEEGNAEKVPPGIYGVPLDVTNIQMTYNKKLLKKAGIAKVPETFDEFIAASDALRRIGIPPFVSGFGELWLAECLASNYAFNIMGEEKVLETYRGNIPYTDPDWIKVFNVFKSLADNNVFIEGIVTKGNKYAEQDFALERAAFGFNGSWGVNVYHGMNADLEYGVMMPPAINPSLPMKVWGGPGSSFVINDRSFNKPKAITFLKWFTSKEQQAFLAKETKNLPSNREALSTIPEVLADFAKGMDNTTHPTIWPVNEHPKVLEAFTKGLQSIIIGEKAPEQVAQEVQAAKEKQMKKKK